MIKAMDSAHRPYPHPTTPWINFQRWNNLCFIHWELSEAQLRKIVPLELELDSYNGKFFVGVVPFEMDRVRPRFFPAIPAYSSFPELNVRTYVKHKGKRGVFFLSLDAARRFFVWGGKKFFHLPYYFSSMSIQENSGCVFYSSCRQQPNGRVDFIAEYKASGEVFLSKPGSLEEFLTERYCLFVAHNNCVKICEIDHQRWPLQNAELKIVKNDLLLPFGIELEGNPIAHYSASLDVRVWPLITSC